MKDKVYCRYCKHYGLPCGVVLESCYKKQYKKDTYYDEVIYYPKPSVKNKNNDCKDFESKKSIFKIRK